MDALGFDVEETKGGNTRGSGYWEAPRKTPGETGAAAVASAARAEAPPGAAGKREWWDGPEVALSGCHLRSFGRPFPAASASIFASRNFRFFPAT